MSFADELRKTRESPAAAFLEFLQRSQKSEDGIHLFFEGKDDSSFYMGFVSRYVPEINRVNIYKCGNRDAVFETYAKVTPRSRPGLTLLFFADKDFSDLLKEELLSKDNIFVTKYYSIENYVVSEEVLQRVWNELLSFNGVSFDFALVKKKFADELANFHRFARIISAWVIFLRRQNLRPNYSNIQLSKVCDLDEDICLQTCNDQELIAYLDKTCSVQTPPDYYLQKHKIERELAAIHPKKAIRGKHEIWFFVQFVTRIASILASNNANGTCVIVRTQITEKNAIEVLGPRVPIPDELDIFLRSNFEQS